jgi:hypothetical protein
VPGVTLPYNDRKYARMFADPGRRPSNRIEYPFEELTRTHVQGVADWIQEAEAFLDGQDVIAEAELLVRGVGAGEPGE